MPRIVAVVTLLAAALAACAPAPTFRGDELYAVHCAGCHGRFGEGDGPAAADRTAPLPDLRYLAARNGGTYPRDGVIAIIDGRTVVAAHVEREMPIWGAEFRSQTAGGSMPEAYTRGRILEMVYYLQSIQEK